MSKLYFISDLHIGHKNICKFAGEYRGGVQTVEEHDQWIVEQWNSRVTKRDTVWVLGDVCFDIDKMPLVDTLRGTKHLILGNHDKFQLGVYQKYFSRVHGYLHYVWKEGKFALSHTPVHPRELRGRMNIHGHLHFNSLDDPAYINVCVEAVGGIPRTLEELLGGVT